MATLADDAPERIVLASEPAFRLGALHVVPALRQASFGGESRTLEPRVMQVLVALARAGGGIVGRDELITCCWGGRIVGENAINRVISILRALSAETRAFEIETITKVGYRLKAEGTDLPMLAPSPSNRAPSKPMSRRAILAAAGVAAAGGVYLLWPGPTSQKRAEAERFHAAGMESERRGDSGLLQAIASYERAVAIDPGYAVGWGALARALAARVDDDSTATEADRARATQAAERALVLDSRNADAWTARVLLEPWFRNWLVMESTARQALAVRPELTLARLKLSLCLSNAGRFRDALATIRQMIEHEPLIPANQAHLAWLLWQVGDVPGARRIYDNAYKLWMLNPRFWTSRFVFLSQTGAIDDALAMCEGNNARIAMGGPLPPALARTCAEALRTGASPRLRQAAVDDIRAARRSGDIASFVSIPFVSMLGDADLAFEQAYGYLFGQRDAATEERQPLPPYSERWTDFLLARSTAAMRADPRFPELTAAIGLDDYWRATGSRPDYRA